MEPPFKQIALLGLPRDPAGLATHHLLYHWLTNAGYSLLVEQELARELNLKHAITAILTDIGQQSDLAVIVGGDGNMLGAARMLACHDTAIIGVNRGKLGFLTDLDPEHVQQQLASVLAGNYTTELRFMLEAQVYNHQQPERTAKQHSVAVNELVLHPGQIAQMIEFEVYIDEKFAFAQRADGLIIATPTGSTAYSLSGGGPILTPTLNAMVLVSMFPHTLSSRPLVIDSNSTLQLHFCASYPLHLCCDGHISLPLQKGDSVLIRKSAHQLRLIHPESYDYFNRLSAKLGWLKKLF